MNKNMVIKDNMITKLLKKLSSFSDAVIVLKGGTSLTKGYGIGDRMSEDADIVYFVNDLQSKTKLKKIKKALREKIKENFDVINENPKGGGSDHYSAEIKVDKLTNDNIKLDLRFSNKKIGYNTMNLKEFDDNGILRDTDITFKVAKKIDTFYDKIFSFQNRSYTKIIKNGRRIRKMSNTEREKNLLTDFKIKRLARHAYDITKIYSSDFISEDIINSKIEQEKNSRFVSIEEKEYLRKTYDKKLHNFLIFNNDKIISDWLRNIKGDFIIDMNIKKIISSLRKIKKEIAKEYKK